MPTAPAITDLAAALAQRGEVARAYDMLCQSAAGGHAGAALLLADWRLSGAIIRRDLGEARDWYGRAAELGLADAEPVHIALLANAAGGIERRWTEAVRLLRARAEHDPAAARQVGLLAGMAIGDSGEPLVPIEPVPVRTDPLLTRLPGFLSPQEAAYLIDLAHPALQPAVVVHPQTGALVRDPIRTARSAAFPFVREDPVLHAINRRIAAVTDTTYEQGEPLQVLCYEPGEEYKLHSDALPPGQNQRTQTFLVTLSEGFTGGETSFPQLGLDLRCAIGEALQFHNTDSKGRPDPRLWHAGKPVRSGRKLMLSKWIRAAPLDLSGPPGRPF
jgi:prolyl 4-hydroxylase